MRSAPGLERMPSSRAGRSGEVCGIVVGAGSNSLAGICQNSSKSFGRGLTCVPSGRLQHASPSLPTPAPGAPNSLEGICQNSSKSFGRRLTCKPSGRHQHASASFPTPAPSPKFLGRNLPKLFEEFWSLAPPMHAHPGLHNPPARPKLASGHQTRGGPQSMFRSGHLSYGPVPALQIRLQG